MAQVDPAAMKAAGIDLAANEHTVLFHFRGSWWPPCRKTLTEVSSRSAELTENSVAVHAIFAQPDAGEVPLAKQLESRGVPPLAPPVHLHSDPEKKFAKLESDPFEKLFLEAEMDVEGLAAMVKKPELVKEVGCAKYSMVQPAMVVTDKTGKVVQSWSWRTMERDGLVPDASILGKTHGGKVPAINGAEGETGLVQIRPDAQDMVAALKEGRPVKLRNFG